MTMDSAPKSNSYCQRQRMSSVFEQRQRDSMTVIWLVPMGLEDLVEATDELLPEAFQRAFAAAQKVSLKKKNQQAHKAVAIAATAAAAAGASPIPFSDAAILVPIQLSMLAKISVVYGLDPTREFLSTLVTSVAGTSAATLTGRLVVTNLLKLVPGAGTVVAGAISATTASALTVTLGEAYIAALNAACAATDGTLPAIDVVLREFKRWSDPKE